MRLGFLTILFAEDDPLEQELMRTAIEKLGLKHTIRFVSDGQEAIEYLTASGRYADRHQFPFPNVIITDLKMPRRTGFQLLVWLNAHGECGVIPTIVLSNSADAKDIKEAYRLAANSYFIKPNDFDQLTALMKMIFDYWFTTEVPQPPAQSKCV